MSYDLAVWEGPAPASDTDAFATYRALIEQWHERPDRAEEYMRRLRGEPTGSSATPAVSAYVDALLARWPDITDDAGEASPWSDGPLIANATGPLFYFGMVFSQAEEAVTFAVTVAREMGLVCFDPQAERLLTDRASHESADDRPRR
jgi:hypothetical protein